MGDMRRAGAVRTAAAAAAGFLLLTSCGDTDDAPPRANGSQTDPTRNSTAQGLERIPAVGDRLQKKIPAESRQVVAVYGDSRNSARSTVVLYTKDDDSWDRTRSWPAHNGKKGWTVDHRENDKRSPVGVFTLTDAGGVLPDPGKGGLPYTESPSFAAPHYWAKTHWHDFDHVIAIDYNRVKNTPPNDPTRPQGQSKGGSIWLHMDHGSGTSGCVSLSKDGMAYLLRTLDPEQHPVVVMGDKAQLKA